MKKIYMKSALAVLALAFAACDNEDNLDQFFSPVQDDQSVTTQADGSSVSQLVFNWQPVDGVIQYGYSLANPSGKVVRSGITKGTTVTLTRLEADTEYTLTVEAFGDNGVATKRFTIKASTAPIVPLKAPEASSMQYENKLGRVFVTWQPVENAEWYEYSVYDDENELIQEGTVSDSQAWIKGLENGDYTIHVRSNSSDEHFSLSPSALLAIVRNRKLVETKSAVYTNSQSGEFKVKMQVYDDGSYLLNSFLGVANYNLEFAIDDELNSGGNKGVVILNAANKSGGWEYVATGLGDDSVLQIYDDYTYCYYYEEESTGKNIYLWAALDDSSAAYDHIQWDDPMELFTVDNFVGTYEMTKHYTESYRWYVCDTMSKYTPFDNTLLYDVEMVKKDDDTLEIIGLLGIAHTNNSANSDWDRVYAYPDFAARTIRIPAQYAHDAEGNLSTTYGIDMYASNHSAPAGDDIVVPYTYYLDMTLSGWSAWNVTDRMRKTETTLKKK